MIVFPFSSLSKQESLKSLQKQAEKAKSYKEVLKEITELSELTAIARWKNTKIQLNNKTNLLKQNKEKLVRKQSQLNDLEGLILNQSVEITKIEDKKK